MDIRMSNIASPMPQIRAKFTNKLGIPLSGCKVYTYEPNSNIPKKTWIDIDKTVENTNPILLDAAGEADIFIDGLYRVVVKDRFGFVVYDVEKTGNYTQWDASFVVDRDETQHEINNSLIRTVKTTSDLSSIDAPKNKQIIYVESIQKKFIYDVNLATPENGVTIIGKWEMEVQEAYYASDLLPRSSIDNVAEPQDVAINKLYQYATSKGRAFIIDQPYYVRSVIKGSGESYPALNPFNGGGVSHAIRVQSNSVLAFMGEGALKLVPSALDFTAILLVHDVENYVILDPKCYGDRYSHLTTTGEQGIAYHFGPSKNGYVRNPYAENCWGDGFYFGFTFYVKPFIDVIVPTNLVIDNPHGYDMSRNGISLCGADNLTINSPYMEKVDRVSPKAGIDIEPEEDINFTDKMFIRNVKIHNATFKSCAFPYTHNIFGSRDVGVIFTGDTKLINGGTTNIAALFQCATGGEDVATYQQNGQILFENIVSSDIFDSDSFSNLFAYYSPEKSIKTVINNWNVDTKVTNLFIRFPRSSIYTNSDGLRVEKFIFNKKPNSITIDSEAVSGNKCNINYHLGIQDDIKINVSGFKYYSTCYIGGYDIIATSIFNENDYINKLIIEPTANPSDGNAIYGRAVIHNNYRKLSYSVPAGLTTHQLGYGLQIQGVGFFMATTTPSGMMSFRQITNPYNGVEVLASYGAWASP